MKKEKKTETTFITQFTSWQFFTNFSHLPPLVKIKYSHLVFVPLWMQEQSRTSQRIYSMENQWHWKWRTICGQTFALFTHLWYRKQFHKKNILSWVDWKQKRFRWRHTWKRGQSTTSIVAPLKRRKMCVSLVYGFHAHPLIRSCVVCMFVFHE